MACRIPGCGTKYWDKNNKISMFSVPSTDYQTWKDILYKKFGIEDFGRNDKICILHFEQRALETTRTVYYRGGSSEVVPLAKPKLAFGACPTIFPSEIPRQKIKYYNVIKDPDILAKQRKLFKESRKDNLMKKAIKREHECKEVDLEVVSKCVSIVTDSDDNVKCVKKKKLITFNKQSSI